MDKPEIKVGDMVRMKPMKVDRIDEDGDIWLTGTHGFFSVVSPQFLEPVTAPDVEKVAGAIPTIEFHQWDWIPGFAAFIDDKLDFNKDSKAFCVLNVGSFMAAVKQGDIQPDDMPYHIARSMMHEVIHVIEKWAKAEFSEERVEALLDEYDRATIKAMGITHE